MKILGYDYKIDLSKSLADMRGNSGFCYFDRQCIEVAENLPEELKSSTLLHEIIEAINYHLSIGLKEEDVMRLEAGLYQTLKDNGVNIDTLVYNDKKCDCSIPFLPVGGERCEKCKGIVKHGKIHF